MAVHTKTILWPIEALDSEDHVELEVDFEASDECQNITKIEGKIVHIEYDPAQVVVLSTRYKGAVIYLPKDTLDDIEISLSNESA